MSVSPKMAGSPEGDAKMIELSWKEPSIFAAIFDRYLKNLRARGIPHR